MSERLVFFPEADDDYQRVAGICGPALLERVCCYVLLADRVVLHPAYLWQSRITNELFYGPLRQLLTGQDSAILLGDSGTAEDYIKDRVSRLEPTRVGKTVLEYLQYKGWGGVLLDQARELDRRFPAQNQIFVKGRDAKFRRLLESDSLSNLDPQSLRAQIQEYIRLANVRIDQDALDGRLQEFLSSHELVSVETFSGFVGDQGLSQLAYSPAFSQRMLNLYYHANLDDRVAAPGLRAIGSRVLDPYDSDVFWQMFKTVFSRRARMVLSASLDPMGIAVVRAVADSPEWREFRTIYFTVLDQVEQALWWNAKSIESRLHESYGYAPFLSHIVSRIWRQKRWELIGVTFGALALKAGGAWWSTPLGAASEVVSLLSLLEATRRYLHGYYSNGFTRVRRLVFENVGRVLHQPSPEGAGGV
ncbi:MAG: hypothetical protein HYY01_02815 [Chloroflexi bacterium]|nr:hypothetical protein [Chloroflexota bacterium]